MLYAYPTTLESLCRLLQSSDHSVSVPVTVCSSETVPESTWRRAADVLGSRLVDYYGSAERVSFAYAFEADSYRFLPGYSYNELIPFEEDSEADLYELVATGLWNLKMPLVRFRTGDLVRVSRGSDPDPVAYGVEPFPGLPGERRTISSRRTVPG